MLTSPAEHLIIKKLHHSKQNSTKQHQGALGQL